MDKIVIANLKMFMTYDDIKKYVGKVSKKVIVCPTNIHIPFFLNNGYTVGIQDISANTLGPYTGEVSALQARELGVSYAIVGHNERQNNEDNQIINKKILQCVDNDLKVVLCIGEKNIEERKVIIKKQIIERLKNVTNFDNLIIAYEPIWCIGTGKTPTNEQIEDAISYIRTIFNEYFNHSVKILYGGSIDENNIESLNQIDGLSGFLIGRVSIESDRINKLIDMI